MGDIAAFLAKQISDLAPGPYYLGGFCGGGLIAYETARQLKAQGHGVALVALFEPHTSYYDYYECHANSVGPRWLVRKLTFHLQNVRHLGVKDGTVYMRDRMRKRVSAFSPYSDKVQRSTLHDAHGGHVKTIGDILYGAYRSYRTQPFDGHVALFQATRREPGAEWEREYWRSLASEMDLHEVPGYSNWLVRFFLEPNVEFVATSLSQYLDNSGTGRIEREHARAATSDR
jgi:thioesterase domain-containing protein